MALIGPSRTGNGHRCPRSSANRVVGPRTNERRSDVRDLTVGLAETASAAAVVGLGTKAHLLSAARGR
jgi:hypothetical protein